MPTDQKLTDSEIATFHAVQKQLLSTTIHTEIESIGVLLKDSRLDPTIRLALQGVSDRLNAAVKAAAEAQYKTLTAPLLGHV